MACLIVGGDWNADSFSWFSDRDTMFAWDGDPVFTGVRLILRRTLAMDGERLVLALTGILIGESVRSTGSEELLFPDRHLRGE